MCKRIQHIQTVARSAALVGALSLALPLLLVGQGGCHMARAVSMSIHYDHPNTITDKGFSYVKQGVRTHYMVRGIFPASLERPELLAKMSIAQNAYAKLWKAAGGLKDNQRFVNLVIESSFVHKVGFGGELFLVVNVYADVIQMQATAPPPSPTPAPTPPPTGAVTPDGHQGSAHVVARIERSVAQAAKRHLGQDS